MPPKGKQKAASEPSDDVSSPGVITSVFDYDKLSRLLDSAVDLSDRDPQAIHSADFNSNIDQIVSICRKANLKSRGVHTIHLDKVIRTQLILILEDLKKLGTSCGDSDALASLRHKAAALRLFIAKHWIDAHGPRAEDAMVESENYLQTRNRQIPLSQ